MVSAERRRRRQNPPSARSGGTRALQARGRSRPCGRAPTARVNDLRVPVEAPDDLDQLARGLRQVALLAVDHQRAPRHVQLRDRNLDQDAVAQLLRDGDARDDGHAHLRLDEALDVLEAPQLRGDAAWRAMLFEQPQDLLFSAAAQVVDDEALAAQIADVDIGTLGQRVTWRSDQDHLVGVDLDALQLVEARFVLDEADVDLAVHHLTGNLCERAPIDADLDVRKARQVVAQRSGQEIHGGRLVRGDVEGASLERLQRSQVAHRIVAGADHLARVFQQRLPGFRERDVVKIASEQLAPDLFLELLDALADGRLRARHALCRACERTFLDDRQKVLELEKVHVLTLGAGLQETTRSGEIYFKEQ